MFKLTERMALIASRVRKNSIICDVGTDHAHIPVYLVKTGWVSRALVTDIVPGPLRMAAAMIDKYCLADKISIKMTDGLNDVTSSDAEDFIIAGMGGELIAGIIEGAEWLRDEGKRLILQPMTEAGHLREYLNTHGFKIVDESLVKERKKIYVVITAEYGSEEPVTILTKLVGKRLIEKKDPLLKDYVGVLIRHYEKMHEGLKRSKNKTCSSDAAEAERILSALVEFNRGIGVEKNKRNI